MHSAWSPRAVVVGSGLAGLVSALELAGAGWEVEVLSAGRSGRDGATHRVHALAPWVLLTAPWVKGDSPRRFLADLKQRGGGMEREGLAEIFAAEAHEAARELIETLDLVPITPDAITLAGDELPRGMRCLPRHRNVLLAPLLSRCAAAGVHLRERTLAVALRVGDGRVVGLTSLDRAAGRLIEHGADAVILACGGSAAVFPLATAPRWCRGSGLAIAAAAGALLHRPALVQALPVMASAPRMYFPTTAALLAGPVFVGDQVLRPGLDLEGIATEIAKGALAGKRARLESPNGASSLLPERVRRSLAFREGGRVALTVAAHHAIGGVAIDASGRASLPGLYAAGEAAGGVQGRRRTMGTGLLEALVFGRRSAKAAIHDIRALGPAPREGEARLPAFPDEPAAFEARLDALLGPLVAWRDEDAVAAARSAIEAWRAAPGFRDGEAGALAALRRGAALAVLGGSDVRNDRAEPLWRAAAI